MSICRDPVLASGGVVWSNADVNLPNALTLTRIFLVPLIVAVLLTKLPSQWSGVPQVTTCDTSAPPL